MSARKAIAWAGLLAVGVLLAAGLLAVRSRCVEATGPLPIAELAAEQYRLVASPDHLPSPIRSEIARALGQPSLHMAAAGQRFNDTDVVMDAGLPWSRLVGAAIGPRHAIVQFETGGFGPTWRTLVFRNDGWSGWVVWSSPGARFYRDQREFAAAIRSGDLWRAAQHRDVKE